MSDNRWDLLRREFVARWATVISTVKAAREEMAVYVARHNELERQHAECIEQATAVVKKVSAVIWRCARPVEDAALKFDPYHGSEAAPLTELAHLAWSVGNSDPFEKVGALWTAIERFDKWYATAVQAEVTAAAVISTKELAEEETSS